MRILLLEPKHLGGLANIWGGGCAPRPQRRTAAGTEKLFLQTIYILFLENITSDQ